MATGKRSPDDAAANWQREDDTGDTREGARRQSQSREAGRSSLQRLVKEVGNDRSKTHAPSLDAATSQYLRVLSGL